MSVGRRSNDSCWARGTGCGEWCGSKLGLGLGLGLGLWLGLGLGLGLGLWLGLASGAGVDGRPIDSAFRPATEGIKHFLWCFHPHEGALADSVFGDSVFLVEHTTRRAASGI